MNLGRSASLIGGTFQQERNGRLSTGKRLKERRYSGIIRRNEQFPDLIVIDGGKIQLAYAQSALDERTAPVFASILYSNSPAADSKDTS